MKYLEASKDSKDIVDLILGSETDVGHVEVPNNHVDIVDSHIASGSYS